MAIEKIIIAAATVNMGDDVTEQDGDNYRAWAIAETRKEYPGVKIEAVDDECNSQVITDDGMHDDEWESAHEFLCELWDRCPWHGEHFD